MTSKVALITGINGQDGSYLAEFLLGKGYEVHGTKRRSSVRTTKRIDHLLDISSGTDSGGQIHLHHADLTDGSSLSRVIDLCQPAEVYNLGAQSHVAVSFEEPEYTANSDAIGVLRLLEIIRKSKSSARFYQASTSELFGGQSPFAYSEQSAFDPRSPYAAAKAYGAYLVRQYREAYGLFAVNGILFNHESPRRGENFVTRKITTGLSKILRGEQAHLLLGNLSASRDWGHARDYVEAMWMMLQLDRPEDFVIASGQSVTVRDFISAAFGVVGIELAFEGHAENEVVRVARVEKDILLGHCPNVRHIPSNGDIVVRVSKSFYRPLEVDHLLGDSAKAQRVMGWRPKTSFVALVEEMVISDLQHVGL